MNPTLKDLAMKPYLEAKEIRDSGSEKLIAWITSDSPHAILEAFGVVCLYPENHAALCAARKMGQELQEAAEQYGFSQDLCSYFRINLGSVIAEKSPIGSLPKPDFLVCTSNICDTVVKWYQVLGKVLKVPVFYIDVPFNQDGISQERKYRHIFYVKYQLNQFIEFLQDATGKKYNMFILQKILARSEQTTRLWREILALAKEVPSPITAFDAFSWMGPIVTQRVTKEGFQYYELLKNDLMRKNSQTREKLRLFWDNIAIWPKLRDLSDVLAGMGASVVVSSYTSCWQRNEFFNPDLDDPLETISRQLIGDFLNQGSEARIKYALGLCQEFSVDGLLLHSNRSCKNYSNTGLELKKRAEKLGLPSLIIEADQCDLRFYDEAKIKRGLEEFLEIIKSKKEVKG